MYTITKVVTRGTGATVYEYDGKSTDTKPTYQVGYNSKFNELDTGDSYFFDGTQWVKMTTSGGGGGGGSTDNTLIVDFPITSFEEPMTIGTPSKTYAEVAAAIDAGGRVVARLTGVVEEGNPPVVMLQTDLNLKAFGDGEYAYAATVISSEDAVQLVYTEDGAVIVRLVKFGDFLQPFVVEMTQGEGGFTSTVTYGDAYSAMQSGRTVMLKINGVGCYSVVAAELSDVEGQQKINLRIVNSSEFTDFSGASTDTISIEV